MIYFGGELLRKREVRAMRLDLAPRISGQLQLAELLPGAVVASLTWATAPRVDGGVLRALVFFATPTVGQHRAAGMRARAGGGVRHQDRDFHMADSTCCVERTE